MREDVILAWFLGMERIRINNKYFIYYNNGVLIVEADKFKDAVFRWISNSWYDDINTDNL